MPSEMDKALDDYNAGRTAPQGCECAGTGWNGAVGSANGNDPVYPCPVHRPRLYARWVEGHFDPGHTCGDCARIAANKPSRTRAAAAIASDAAEEPAPPAADWWGHERKDLS